MHWCQYQPHYRQRSRNSESPRSLNLATSPHDDSVFPARIYAMMRRLTSARILPAKCRPAPPRTGGNSGSAGTVKRAGVKPDRPTHVGPASALLGGSGFMPDSFISQWLHPSERASAPSSPKTNPTRASSPRRNHRFLAARITREIFS